MVKTDEFDELARANLLRSDIDLRFKWRLAPLAGRVLSAPLRRPHSNQGCLLQVDSSSPLCDRIRPHAFIEILRIANAIGNAAAQSSAMNQNARGPNAP